MGDTIIPAILPHSRRELEVPLARLATVEGIRSVQLDVVDGRFATPASWPFTNSQQPTANSQQEARITLPYAERFIFDIDLMVEDPERVAGDWLALVGGRLTLHAASVPDIKNSLATVKRQHGHEAGHTGAFELGLAIGVETVSAIIEGLLDEVDYVQFMGIRTIGRQGEPFDKRVLAKIAAFHKAHPEICIQVDGGVSLVTAPKLFALGASRPRPRPS